MYLHHYVYTVSTNNYTHWQYHPEHVAAVRALPSVGLRGWSSFAVPLESQHGRHAMKRTAERWVKRMGGGRSKWEKGERMGGEWNWWRGRKGERQEETGGGWSFSSAICVSQFSANISRHACTIWCLWYNQVGTCVRLAACCTTATCLNFRATTSGLSWPLLSTVEMWKWGIIQ